MRNRKNDTFKHYVASVLRRSMLTGIPQIAEARNATSKLVRLLVFVICVFGFTYQCLEFMNVYWKYETTLDIQVANPKTSVLPSWTICTNNGVRTEKMCPDPRWNRSCISIRKEHDLDWCRCFPRFCKNGEVLDIKVPSYVAMYELGHLPYPELQPLFVSLEDLVVDQYCKTQLTNESCGFGHYKSIGCSTDRVHRLHACYTVHTLLDKPDEEQPMYLSEGGELFLVDSLPDIHNMKVTAKLIYLSIHHARTAVNPIVQGHSLEMGNLNIFYLKRTVKKLLPPPYETNCMDYITLWNARGGRGPTTERECIHECLLNSSLKIRGCHPQSLTAPSNEIRCQNDKEKIDAVISAADDCELKNCRPACFEDVYEATKTSYAMDIAGSCLTKDTDMSSVAAVEIKLNGMPTTVYTYGPKYQPIESFSYLGGYIGMWLGISLVAAFDFFETLVLVMKFPFSRFRAKNRRIGNIREY